MRQKVMVECAGPIVTVQMVVKLYGSSSERPTAQAVKDTMDQLEKDQMGKNVDFQRVRLFFKQPPKEIDEELLRQYRCLAEYTQKYKEKPSNDVIPEAKMDLYLSKAPADISSAFGEYGWDRSA